MGRVKGMVRRLPGYATIRDIVRVVVGSGRARREAMVRLIHPSGLFQPYATTRMDRYPDCFAFAHTFLGDGPQRHILSFGCASGEEVMSLRRVFPQARITGIDINPANIRLARRRLKRAGGDSGIRLRCAGSVMDEPAEHYDTIFAMAVFRHGDLTRHSPRCDPWIRFADFDLAVADLARVLRPGGLLVIRHAHFRFIDTAVSADFEQMQALAPPRKREPLFGRDNRLLPDEVCADGVFRKR